MTRSVRRFFFLAALVGLAACAESGAQTLTTDVAIGDTVAEASSTTAATGDFGSRYVGAPVAFWFWAPY